jgi:hypothetical protein
MSPSSHATSQHLATIYSALYTAFNVPRYQELAFSRVDAG